MRHVDIVVIGGGPAGLAAALGAYEAGARDILILEREAALGGILRQCIHNGFGLHTFGEELTGPEYAKRFVEQVLEKGIAYACGTMVIDVSPEKTVTCVSRAGGLQRLEAGAVIFAMGCRERPRGSLGTPGTRCAGVYTAGAAQKFVNLQGLMPGKRCVILGSGDIGLIMARRMTLMGAEVLCCVELMPYSSGLKRNIVQCLEDFNIPLLLSHTVVDIQGRERLEGVTVARVDEARRPIPGTEQTLACDTLLLSVGLIPENELSAMAGVELSPGTLGAAVDERLATSVDGIFACGNVLHVHDLVDFVSLEAKRAGKSAARYLQGETAAPRIPVCMGEGVGALVPQYISRHAPESVELSFRPKAVYHDAWITVQAGERALLRKKARVLAPGEMVNVTLPAEALEAAGEAALMVCIETGEAKKA